MGRRAGHRRRHARRGDDAAPAGGHHHPRRVLGTQERAHHVEGHHALQLLLGAVPDAQAQRAGDAGVVEHDVQRPEPRHGVVHGGGDVGLVGHVAVHVAGVLRAELGAEARAELVLDVGDHDAERFVGNVVAKLSTPRVAG